MYINTYELSPKINCCKMEYLFILRFKGPLRFSMFGTRLSFKQFWLCFFLKGSHHFGCCAPFWRPCTFACVPVRLYSIGFCRSVAARSLFEVGLACFYKWKTVFLILPSTRDCIVFPGKAHNANSRSAASSLVRWIGHKEATPCESEKFVKLPSFSVSVCLRFGKAQQN